MRGQKSWRAGMLLACTALVVAALGSTPAQGEVRGDVKLVGEKPVSGTFDLDYNNYSEKFCTEGGGAQTICHVAYRVSRGTAAVKLRTYKLVEGMHNYDYFIVDVEVTNENPYGGSEKGWMKVHIDKSGNTPIVDYSDTKSVYADQNSCKEISLSFGTSIGPAGASVGLGSVKFCDEAASFPIDYRDGTRTVWMAHHMRKINVLTSERIVKVARGDKPSFEVKIHVPTDTCTDSYDGGCTDFTNDTTLKTYTIHTTGL